MTYANVKEEIKSMIQNTDMNNIKKEDAVRFSSKLSEYSPEVAKAILNQFPEITKILQASLPEYLNILSMSIKSDDTSSSQLYGMIDKKIDGKRSEQEKHYSFVEKVREDISKQLENPNISSEERTKLIEKEISLIGCLNEYDREKHKNDMEALEMASKKDSENKYFKIGLMALGAFSMGTSLGICTSVLGGNFNYNLPNFNMSNNLINQKYLD